VVDQSEPTLDEPDRATSASRGAHAAPEPIASKPWKRSKPRYAFAGDIAALELRNRLALPPDRLREPPPVSKPVSRSPQFVWAGRLAGLMVVAAAGFIGYRWGSAPPTDMLQGHFLPASDRADVASEQWVSVNLSGPGLDSKPDAVRPAASATPSGSPPEQSASFAASPGLDRPFVAPRGTEVDRPPPREPAEGGPSQSREPLRGISDEDRERALRLKQKGDEQLAQGLIAPARLLYERAADLGLAEAALALAATYDQSTLARSNLRGISPDPKAAAHWYERARLLAPRDPERQMQSAGRN
jgi:hypothetical protein